MATKDDGAYVRNPLSTSEVGRGRDIELPRETARPDPRIAAHQTTLQKRYENFRRKNGLGRAQPKRGRTRTHRKGRR